MIPAGFGLQGLSLLVWPEPALRRSGQEDGGVRV